MEWLKEVARSDVPGPLFAFFVSLSIVVIVALWKALRREQEKRIEDLKMIYPLVEAIKTLLR
jgi:membrane protein implicated in regulation of membrane protease activity